MAVQLPDAMPGYWDSHEGAEIARQQLGLKRDALFMGDISDLALANAQYLVSRHSLELIHYQTAAKERIRWLSAQLAASEARSPSAEAIPEELTPELRDILGFMCFELGKLAHAYQAAGRFVAEGSGLKRRAEDERAFMLHRFLLHWQRAGANWRESFAAELEEVVDAASADKPDA